MSNNFPLNTDKTPNAVMEVILRLKIKDAMTKNVIKCTKDNTLREIQQIMKEKKISGIPIVEEDRIIGLVSVNDIMNALDNGYIEEKAEKYMSKNLVMLEDDMPLSFAITYFNKYSFRRFPIINKERKLVGMISSRDVLTALLRELNKEIKILEDKIKVEKTDIENQIYKEFFIKKYDFENAGHASFELKKLLKEKNVSQKVIRKASVASYELEINIAIHSEGGKMIFILDDKKLQIIAKDNGPGIADVNLVVQEGYSTANEWIRSLGFGAGMGIPNTKRVSDEFKIESELGKGSTFTSIIYLEDKNENQ